MMRKASLLVSGALAGAAATLVAVQPSRLVLSSARAAQAGSYRALTLFGGVFEQVRAHYVEKPDDRKLIESAIDGMLNGLDPHSSYMDSRSFLDMEAETRGEFGGLGIEVTLENGFINVVSPIDDTPAAKAGIRAGDIITHLDGEPIQGLTLDQAIEKMRGPEHSVIRLRITRRGEEAPIEIAITRARIQVHSVRTKVEGGDVGFIRVTQFTEQTTDGVRTAIRQIASQIPKDKLKGYVIDLRNNPGGLLDQAISVSGAFLERGEIVSIRGRDLETERFRARASDLTKGKPVIVLINGGSASASEIVAGALQDHRRATLVGTRSFGKGSVQTIIPLGAGNGALRLTTARYFTPSGRSIQAKGISPDIEVVQDIPEEVKARTTEIEGESSLRGHLKGEGSEEAGSQSYVPADEKDDKALAMALELLRGTKTNPAFPPNPKSAHLPN
jgi:carboxyl-terminal processing protease